LSDTLDPGAAARLRRVGGARLLRGMIALFLEQGPVRLAAAEAGLASGRLGEAERAWHSLRSSAGNLGAARLAQAAQHAETAAAAGQGAAAAAAGATVRTEYPGVEAALRELLRELEHEEDRAG
jgi:HPt (histidine-containing phosphotransfer) domain-containing protein